jgi:hypothetical protein
MAESYPEELKHKVGVREVVDPDFEQFEALRRSVI